MENYKINKKERDILASIEEKYYMLPPLSLIKKEILKNKHNKKLAWQKVLDNLHDFIRNSQNEVEKLLQKRRQQKKIKDIRQARVSIVGNMFSKLIIYIFIQNKICKSIRNDIFITSKLSEIKNFDKIGTIRVGEESQKPDIDLIIYTEKSNRDIEKCIIISLKTSLRERAGQTYKWKLLMEIATTENPIRKKYNIEYNPESIPLICFVTVNFYNEVDKPQHRGMFKFFDNSFIGKKIDSDFISPLSHLIKYVNEKL